MMTTFFSESRVLYEVKFANGQPALITPYVQLAELAASVINANAPSVPADLLPARVTEHTPES